jgi:hypothetical protein
MMAGAIQVLLLLFCLITVIAICPLLLEDRL